MNLVKKSFSILNTSLLPVLIIYILNVISAKLTYLNLGILAVILIPPLKIFIYSGTCGMLIELVSNEEIVPKFERFMINAKKYWKCYFVIVAFPFLVYLFFVKNIVSPAKIDLFSFFSYINPLLLFIFAVIIIRDKYGKAINMKKAALPFPLSAITPLLLLFIAELFFFHLPYFIEFQNFSLSRITYFFYIYINLLIFVYCSCLTIDHFSKIKERFTRGKEIYLINPLGGGLAFHLSSYFIRSYPPLFVVIKALTPKTYGFREFNRFPWKNRYYASNKLVAITCYTSNSMDTYKIAREFQKHGSKVILGGPHVTYFPDEALEYCDSVVCGELESVWPEVIKDYEDDRLQKKYIGEPLENCHKLVHEELLNSPPKVIKGFLEASRGCKFKCYFCTVPSLSRGKLRKQDISDFVELIKTVKKKYNHVIFIDNNIYSDPAYAKKLFQALKPLNMNWSTQCSIDIAKNKKVLKLAKRSGCRSLLIGFEISEGSFEKIQGGKLALVDHYQQYAKEIKKMGISIDAHFIFGFESDSFKHLYRFWKFCFKMRPSITALSILTPFPGSQFYYDMIKQDRISNLNWRHYGGQTLVFKHLHMNNFILTKSFSAILIIFFFTTSKAGYLFFFITIVVILKSI